MESFAKKQTLNLTISARFLGIFLAAVCWLVPLTRSAAAELPPDFSQDDLQDAIDAGGVITFPTNSIFALTATVTITNNVTFDGKRVATTFVTNYVVTTNDTTVVTNPVVTTNTAFLTVSNMVGFSGLATNGFRLFNVLSNVTVTFDHIQFVNGGGSLGGAISNGGNLILSNAFFRENHARGKNGRNGTASEVDATDGGNGFGGALFNVGTTLVYQSFFLKNTAEGGKGGLGQNGASDSLFGKPGGRGGNGGLAAGGAIYNRGTIQVVQTAFQGNSATAGDGGFAGLGGSAPFPGASGDAGAGGSAYGGAIYNLGFQTNSQSLYFDNRVFGGDTAAQLNFKNGRAGGNAAGGAVFNSKNFSLVNSTVVSNLCIAGIGGGVQAGALIYGGRGGNATGGGLHNIGNASLTNCTFAAGSISNGLGGLSLNADGLHNGAPGFRRGGNLYAGLGKTELLNCIVAYGAPTNSFGTLRNRGFNLSSDRSCAFVGLKSTNNSNPKLGELKDNGGPTFTMALLQGSPALDRGPLKTLDTNSPFDIDQRGTNRVDATNDIGAFESVGPFTVSGRVTFGSNQPAGGLVILVTNVATGSAITATNGNAITNDAEGNFSVVLDKGLYSFTPLKGGSNLINPVFTNILSDTELNLIVANITIKGRVTNKAGIGMMGVTISTTNEQFGQGFSVTSGVNGVYILKEVARSGTNVVSASGPNGMFFPASTNVVYPKTNNINFLRIPTFTVSGAITNNGFTNVIVTNLMVLLQTNSASGPLTNREQIVFTVSRGKFTFTNVLAGNYIVRPVATNLIFTPESKTFRVTSNVVNLKFVATNATTTVSTNAPE